MCAAADVTPRPVLQIRPIVTLTSDFGTDDFYVASMKAVLLKRCPEVRLLDVTHGIPRHDVLCGSIALERAVDGFPPGTFHLAVVDPGVGTDRRLLIARANGQTIVCPDNGLITWTARRHPPVEAFELTWRPKKSSRTFHGRDVMGPAVAALACGEPVADLARPIDDPVLLDVAPCRRRSDPARVIHVDGFGNATTNVSHDVLQKFKARGVRVKGLTIGRVRRTYWDVAPGKPLALVGSSGLREIAVRDGSAAAELGLKVGDEVSFE